MTSSNEGKTIYYRFSQGFTRSVNVKCNYCQFVLITDAYNPPEMIEHLKQNHLEQLPKEYV